MRSEPSTNSDHSIRPASRASSILRFIRVPLVCVGIMLSTYLAVELTISLPYQHILGLRKATWMNTFFVVGMLAGLWLTVWLRWRLSWLIWWSLDKFRDPGRSE